MYVGMYVCMYAPVADSSRCVVGYQTLSRRLGFFRLYENCALIVKVDARGDSRGNCRGDSPRGKKVI